MTRARRRLMTYNIKCDTTGDPSSVPVSEWTPARRSAVAGVIAAVGADVVALQEVLAHQLEDLRADLSGYASVGIGRDDGVAGGEHVPLLVRSDRWQIREWGTFWLSPTPRVPSRHPDAACARVCTWAVLDGTADVADVAGVADVAERPGTERPNAPLRVWNVHLDHEGEQARADALWLVLEHIAAAAARERGHDVVLGDLNAGPGSEPVAAALTRLRDAREVSRTRPTGPGATFHDWVPAGIDGSGAEHPERIDYVLVGPTVQVQSYDVPTIDGSNAALPSDHYPVVVDVELTGVESVGVAAVGGA